MLKTIRSPLFYGDGSGGAGNKGAKAQDDIADPDINGSTGAFFTIRSAGSADGTPEFIKGVERSETLPESDLPGKVYTTDIDGVESTGMLEIAVKGAESGSGTVTVAIDE